MRFIRSKLGLLMLLSGGLLCGLGGSCLPPNFFADLAGDVINTTVDAVVAEILDAMLNTAGAA